jgi:hypothetical protein
MPTKKPRFDKGGEWKYPKFTPEQWEALQVRVGKELRKYYPDKSTIDVDDSPFGHPADAWANSLLSEAKEAVSTILWHGIRLTNEELRNERTDILKTLEAAENKLDTLSLDLDILLGFDADVLGCRDKIKALIPYFQNAEARIAELPKAKRISEAQNAASLEMAMRVLRVLSDRRIKITATHDIDLGYTSDAVEILKILGDAIGLVLARSTWKTVVIKTKP